MKRSRAQAGFSLLELVLALTLSGVLATAFLPMVRTAQQRSAELLIETERMFTLQNQMELLVAAEYSLGGTLAGFQSQVSGLLQSGITLEECRFVQDDGSGGLEDAATAQNLLLVSLRDTSGYRLRRLFSQ